jgi:lysophospholipase L1-like esterase
MTVTMEALDRHCLRPGEAEAQLAGARWGRLLAMGDSIVVHPGDPVAGYRAGTWTDRLVAALGTTAYLNLGVSGARVAEIRAGQLAAAVRFGPDLAILAAGANDAVRRSFDPAVAEAELEPMIAALAGSGALVVTMGCFDVGGPEVSARLRVLGALTRGLSQSHGGIHVDFADHPAQQEGVLGADGVHINARGHAVVATEIVRALGNLLRGRL